MDAAEGSEHDDRHQALTGLGYLVNRSGSERALRYLVDGLAPGVWRERKVQGFPPWARSYAEYDRQLSTYSLMALAVSGDPRAGEALRSLQVSPTRAQAPFREGLDSTLEQWIEVHDLVAERGVEGMNEYYAGKHRAEVEREVDAARRRGVPYPNPPGN